MSSRDAVRDDDIRGLFAHLGRDPDGGQYLDFAQAELSTRAPRAPDGPATVGDGERDERATSGGVEDTGAPAQARPASPAPVWPEAGTADAATTRMSPRMAPAPQPATREAAPGPTARSGAPSAAAGRDGTTGSTPLATLFRRLLDEPPQEDADDVRASLRRVARR